MACPKCGSTAGSTNGRCPACGAVAPADAGATATLTPPPRLPTGIGATGETVSPFGGATGADTGVHTGSFAGAGPLSVGQNFGQRYHIIRLLGIGGMGAVYQAWDQVLEVAVAVKVIRTDPTADPATAADLEKRFKRELLLARQVTHKNVVRIHDLGEIDGIKYITMPYIHGSDLASVLRHEGRLAVPRALAITKQVVSGLTAAHEAGVVHRDLKPANIMIDAEDHACVMDFGIARSTSGGTGVAMTAAGAVVGTVEYMAPEQAKGESVDQRADVYALGLIFRDMLLGVRKHNAGTAMQDLMARMLNAPPSLRSVDPTMPQPIEDIVSRCLQPDPAARYQTTTALLHDLEQLTADGQHAQPQTSTAAAVIPPPWRRWPALAAAGALVAVLLGGAALWISGRPSDTPVAAVPSKAVSIAVLPFRNQTGDTSLDSLGPSVAEVLRSELGQTAYIRTVPAERLDQVLSDLKIESDAALDPAMLRRIADLTNADVVLRGLFSKLGNEIHLTATLHDLRRGSADPVLAQAPDQNALLNAVDTLARGTREKIVSAETNTKLASAAAGSMSRSFEAVRAYTEGLRLARQSNHQEAIARFKAATESDSGFALAYSRMALSHSAMGYDAEAQQASRRGVDLSESAPPADRFFILATDASIKNETDKAIEYYQKLLDAAPSDVYTRYELALLLESANDLNGAREQLAAVLAEDPKYVNALLAAGRVEIKRASPRTSLEPLNQALTLSIDLGNDRLRADVLQAIGVAYKRLVKPDDALRHYRESLDIKRRLGNKGGMASSLGEIAQVQARLGQTKEALQSYREAEQLRREIGDRAGLGNTLLDVGSFHLEQARYDDALTAFKQSLQIQRELGDRVAEARALNNIGSAYFDKAQYEDALTYFERALTIREKQGNPSELSQTHHNIAETHVRMGQLDRALEQYLSALDLARNAGEARTEAIEAHSMGTVFEYQGRYGAALKSREGAYERFSQLNDRSLWNAEIVAGYGRSLVLVGRLEDGRKFIEEGIKIAREQGNHAILVRALNDDGERLRLSGDVDGARKRFDEAGQIAAKLGDRSLVIRTQLNQALLSSKDPRHAATAAKTLGTLAQQADTQGLRHLAIEAALGRAEALLTVGQHQQARSEAQRALTRAENSGMRTLEARAHHLAGLAAQATGAAAEARRHFGHVKRLLDAATREARPGELGRRGDVAEMLGDASKEVR